MQKKVFNLKGQTGYKLNFDGLMNTPRKYIVF